MSLSLEALGEQQLVTLAQGRNGDAFAELIRRTRSSGLRTAQVILGSRQKTEYSAHAKTRNQAQRPETALGRFGTGSPEVIAGKD